MIGMVLECLHNRKYAGKHVVRREIRALGNAAREASQRAQCHGSHSKHSTGTYLVRLLGSGVCVCGRAQRTTLLAVLLGKKL